MDLTKDQVKQRIIEEIDKSKEQIINFAKDIAENAETGYREIQTAKKVKEIFSQLNLNFTDGHAITGVKASPITGRSSGPTIAVIGELDGLIVKDHPLADKVTNAVHACGHNCQLGSMFGVGLGLINAQANHYFNGNVVLFAVPAEEYPVSSVLARAIDRLFILHADHEQNASTSTVRLAGSSGANPFACIAAGIASLWGPAHGGANEAVIKMLEEIGEAERIPEFIRRAKDKDDPFRLMGFGHRVYKNYDPRATVMRHSAHEVLEELGSKDEPLLKLAIELEKLALEDSYFVERKLFPNVDFYSGIILRAMGIPTDLFTVLFAVARTVGWLAQWDEMICDPGQKIGRPRQLYTGPVERPFIPISAR